MLKWVPVLGFVVLSMSGGHVAASGGGYPTDAASLASGRELAEIHCAVCHAVGPDDESAQAGAPAFRDLSSLYPLDSLEEPLAEGIVTGHDGMPEFAFAPDDIDAFLGYLASIQAK
ncbi:cytochrome c [Labrenzia sp. OB1]|uniref:c-type cytochrome n=1 Tax=Labrenzia sp. OB1 TaxID=1561204 RepID=UPI0007B2DEAA|nr:cytochrome c [Labrenzia sp. OB1]KZM49204.1 cytochrome C [Labrenzia sp. OB1]